MVPMNEARQERMSRLKDIVCDILEIEPEELTPSSLFIDDHHADSLRAIEILATIEKEFSVKIPQENLVRMVNLDGVYGVVNDVAGWDS